MTTLAVLDPNLPRQIQQNPAALSGLEIIFTGTDTASLLGAARRRRPDVVIVNTSLLGEEPVVAARRISKETGAALVIALYQYAKREFLQAMNADGVRAMKEPTSLEQLRSQMMSLIVKNLFSSAPAATVRAPMDPGVVAFTPGVDARLFSDDALARLCEIQTSVDCECPNHLAQIITGLAGFERYSASCSSRNEADAEIHRLLARASGEARVVMEKALQKLLVHEGIAI